MTTWDCFMFSNELDMLECRLMEAQEQDVHHVLIEAPWDHRGNAKPLYYAEHQSRFAPWKDRITHIVADIPGPGDRDPWDREHAQREHLWAGLNDAEPNDMVLLCDVDEIPSKRAYRLQGTGEMVALNMRLSMFAVDWVVAKPPETRIAIAAPFRTLRIPAFQFRDNRVRSGLRALDGMGWHFTWLGGPDAIRAKAAQFCHLELQDMILKANEEGLLYERGMTWYADQDDYAEYPPKRPHASMVPATIDDTWPRYIREGRCPDSWFRPRR